jgi:hypothetical protein
VLHDPSIRAVDQLVEVHQRLRAGEIPGHKRVERDPDHLLAARRHLLEALDQLRVGRDLVDELRQLRDRHAEVGDPLESEVDVEHGQHEAKVDCDGRLPSQERLDSLLEVEVALVDLVVERDHLVRHLRVALLERLHRAAESALHELALLHQGRLQSVELFLQPDAHQPNLPVT